MKTKLLTLMLVVAFYNVNCQEKNETMKGYFSVEPGQINKVMIEYFKTLNDTAPVVTKIIDNKAIVAELVNVLARLPAEGDILKKIAASSSRYKVRFYKGTELAGKADIYNNSLQMSNTAFLSKENKDEVLFVKRIKELFKEK